MSSPRRSPPLYPDFETCFPAVPVCVSSARRRLLYHVTEWWCLPITPTLEDYLLAVHEAVANAVRHGCDSDSQIIKLRVDYSPANRLITALVLDPGPGFDASAPFRAECVDGQVVCCCGRQLIRHGVDSVDYERRGAFHACILTKTL